MMSNQNTALFSRIEVSRKLIAALVLMIAIGCSRGLEGDSTLNAEGSDMQITGRLSMGQLDPFQCYMSGSYSGPEKVGNRWIAGIDGTALGTMYDASRTPNNPGSGCGRTFTITVGNRCENFVVVDRIWENDGRGQKRYRNKVDADQKQNAVGEGYSQLDIAKAPFQSLFNGHNPTGNYRIQWGATCSEMSQAQPIQRPQTPQTPQIPPQKIPESPSQTRNPNPQQPVPTQQSLSAEAASKQPISWYPTCATGVSCANGWGWHAANTNQCSAGSGGWIPGKGGCSCRCWQ